MPICEVGLSSTSSSSRTVDLRPISERSGPFTFPLPATMWQFEHCPFPKKNCPPAIASPAGLVSIPAIFSNLLGILDFAKTTEAERFCRNALALHARLFRLWHRFGGDDARRPELTRKSA